MVGLIYPAELQINEASTSDRYQDGLFNTCIDNPYFEGMVGQIDPAGLQLNKANNSDSYSDNHLNIDNPYIEGMVKFI